MSMFQIMTQEGWIEVMQDAMNRVGSTSYIPVSRLAFQSSVFLFEFTNKMKDAVEFRRKCMHLSSVRNNPQLVAILKQGCFQLRSNFWDPKYAKLYILNFNGRYDWCTNNVGYCQFFEIVILRKVFVAKSVGYKSAVKPFKFRFGTTVTFVNCNKSKKIE